MKIFFLSQKICVYLLILKESSLKRGIIFKLGLPFGKVQISVLVNGLHQGSTNITIENKKNLLKQQMGDAFSPIEFLCQVLPLHGSDRKQFEDEIENKMKDNEFAVTMVGNICDTNLSYGELTLNTCHANIFVVF